MVLFQTSTWRSFPNLIVVIDVVVVIVVVIIVVVVVDVDDDVGDGCCRHDHEGQKSGHRENAFLHTKLSLWMREHSTVQSFWI